MVHVRAVGVWFVNWVMVVGRVDEVEDWDVLRGTDLSNAFSNESCADVSDTEERERACMARRR